MSDYNYMLQEFKKISTVQDEFLRTKVEYVCDYRGKDGRMLNCRLYNFTDSADKAEQNYRQGLINIYDLSKKEAMNVEVVVKEIEEVLR